MVLLDIGDCESAMANCLGALRDGGRFIFSLLHSCWPPEAMTTWAKREHVELTEYVRPYAVPTPQGSNYHRPLSTYLSYALSLDTTINEIAEPAHPGGSLAESLPGICAHIPHCIGVSLSRCPIGK
jgi:hypothetical protein